MRKAFSLYFSSLLVLFLVSCGKEQSIEIDNEPPVAAPGLVRMKIDGVQWTADNLTFAVVGTNFIQINGFGKDQRVISINLLDSLVKTYMLDQAGNYGGAVFGENADIGVNAYSTVDGVDSTQAGGSVIVTSLDPVNKTVSGTFKFKVFRDLDKTQKVITEGIFEKVSFSTDVPPAKATDTFNVKIDNADWVGKSITSFTRDSTLVITASELNLSKTVALAMRSDIIAGTYDLDLSSKYFGQYNPSFTSSFRSQSGKLTIIEHNKVTKRIRGNFNFKAIDLVGPSSAQLTLGYFSVAY